MPTEEQIKELAYAIWEQEGRPEGKAMQHYLAAKQILEEREAAQASAGQSPSPPAAPPKVSRPSSRARKPR